MFGQDWPSSAKCGSNVADVGHGDPIRSSLRRIRPKLVHNCQTWPNCGRRFNLLTLVRRLFGNSWTTSKIAGIVGGSFSGHVASSCSITIG